MTEAALRQLVSIVVPAYDEAPNVAGTVALFHEIRRSRPDLDFEIVLIDDGSTDGTAELFIDALDEGDVARVASFSRNFGSHAGLSAGFALCRGDCAITMSADLQEPVEVVGRLIEQWRAGSDIVWAIRSVRADQRGLSSRLALMFNNVFARNADLPAGFPQEGPSQMLVSRQVLDVVNTMPELNRNILALVAWTGFRQATLAFQQRPRRADRSKWTTSMKAKLVFDSFVGYSFRPVLLTLGLSLLLMVAGALGVLATLSVALITLSAPNALAVLVGLILAVGGVQLACIGILGQYVARAGADARGRPLYVIRSVSDVDRASTPGRRPRREHSTSLTSVSSSAGPTGG